MQPKQKPVLKKVAVIPLKVHNVLDYVDGVSLIASPFAFGFSDVPAARNMFIGLGLNAITYSAMTDYPYSLAKLIPLRVHMVLDLISGMSIMGAPYILGYQKKLRPVQRLLHFVLGTGVLAMVAMTRVNRQKAVLEMIVPQAGSDERRRAA